MRFHLVLLSFFIPFCFLNLSFNISVAASFCHDHQQFLLLHMKQNLIFSPAKSNKLVTWNQSRDCCQWNGVACHKGHVIGLDLSEESIYGGLDNSSLFNLEYLQRLNLAYNDFRSLIPSEIDKIKNLRYLNLSNAGFEGQIPKEIAHLTKLAILDLSTSFTSLHPLRLDRPNIGTLMQNLVEIIELYLDGVIVSAVGKEWCHALSSLQKIQIMSLSSCNLSGPIDSSLTKLQSLSVIQLSLNNLSSPIPKFLANLSSLTTLQLSSCGLIDVFPNDIFQIQKIKMLDISENQDLGGSLPNFPQDRYLQNLNLSYTNLSGQLPSAISNLKQLNTLDLSNCHFHGALPISFYGLTQLVHLDLSFNNFTGPLPSLTMSKNLKYLSLLHNDFTGPIPSSYLKGLSNLLVLNLGDNSLNGRVPSSLFTLVSLHEVTLSHNSFDGVLDEFSNASSSALQLVDLSSNRLQGTIPVSLFHLKKLNFIQLSLNQFNGTIRLEMIWRLPNLQTLGLSHNNLTVDSTFNEDPSLSSYPSKIIILLASCKLREFPTFLRNQSKLVSLDLSNNQIQGIIPNWIWRFDMDYLNLSNNFLTNFEGPFENISSNMFWLDLHSNQLGASIPIFTKNAVYLDYSSNRFSFIPPNMKEYLGFIYFLSFSNNSFHGKIPESFCDSPYLRMLDLSHNSFDGSIPVCLTSRSNSIRVLNIVGNKLSGSISDRISSSCNLRFLNLNGNLLGGTIPKSLANCQSLEVLNLGNNVLNDRFPCFLRNISTLRVLILRSNKLQGPIKCPLNTNDWKMLHIVDLASNNFTDRLPRSLLQSWKAMMDDKDGNQEKSSSLFFDMYDFHRSEHYQDVMAVLDKVLVIKLAKLRAGETLSTIKNLFSYFVKAYQLQFAGAYLDSATIINKGLQMNLIKIVPVFTSLDFSFNQFQGPIPEELMNLRALIVLNLSHNAFSSHIPSSLGNLIQIESLDLSSNTLSGDIPTQITSLHFLSVLNLSFNHLVGKIPTGTQIQSFEADSFKSNEGLCGPPLTKHCSDDNGRGLPSSSTFETHSVIDWNFLSVELGFIFGFGFVIFPLIFFKRWRLWFIKHMDDLLYKIFPQLDFVYELHGGHNYRTLRWRSN